jgi:metacaspase-1
MAAYSIHIGLDGVDNAKYGQEIACLNSPVQNALAMQQLAVSFGVPEENRFPFIGDQATWLNIKTKLDELATSICKEGDFVFVTFSGHGTQFQDLDGVEPDKKDEALVVYDRPFLDDQLCSSWAKFQQGVRVFLLVDACHSGSIVKHDESERRDLRPCKLCQSAPRKPECSCCCDDGSPVKAAILSISAVRDDQEAQDGENLSKFTKAVMDVYNGGRFEGTFEEFHRALSSHSNMSAFRIPSIQELGKCKHYFKSHKMFH